MTRRESLDSPEWRKVLAMLREPGFISQIPGLDNDAILASWLLLGRWLQVHPSDAQLQKVNRALAAEGAKRKPS